MRDILFIAIVTGFGNGVCQLGTILQRDYFKFSVSLLDTADLRYLITALRSNTRPTLKVQDALKSDSFCLASLEGCGEVSREFLFRKSKIVHIDQIKQHVEVVCLSK